MISIIIKILIALAIIIAVIVISTALYGSHDIPYDHDTCIVTGKKCDKPTGSCVDCSKYKNSSYYKNNKYHK